MMHEQLNLQSDLSITSANLCIFFEDCVFSCIRAEAGSSSTVLVLL